MIQMNLNIRIHSQTWLQKLYQSKLVEILGIQNWMQFLVIKIEANTIYGMKLYLA